MFNPFLEIIENRQYIGSHAYRTSLGKKIKDMYFVFAGTFFDDDENKCHVGLYDYMTLGLAYSSAKLVDACKFFFNDSIFAKILIAPAIMVALPLNALRYVVAGILTAIFAPVAILSHIFTLNKGNRLKRRVKSIVVDDSDSSDVNNLGELLAQNRMDLENVSVDLEGTYKKFNIVIRGDKDHSVETTIHNFKPAENKKQFKALLRLNVGNVTNKLETADSRFKLFFQNDNTALPKLPISNNSSARVAR